MPTEKFTNTTKAVNSVSPSTKWYKNSNFCLIFKGSCLKKNAIPPNIKFSIVCKLDAGPQDLNSRFTLNHCLFGGVKLAKKSYPYK